MSHYHLLEHRLLNRAEEADLATQIQAGIHLVYEDRQRMDTGGRLIYPVRPEATLTSEEKQLRRVAIKARNTLVSHNYQLIQSIINNRYGWSTAPQDDMFMWGVLGCTTAAEKFNPSKGNKFSTVATWWIWQKIGRETKRHSQAVRIPDHLWEKAAKWEKLLRSNPTPTDEQTIAIWEGPTVAEAKQRLALWQQSKGVAALDKPVGEGDSRMIDLIPSGNDLWETLEHRTMLKDVRLAIEQLNSPQQRMAVLECMIERKPVSQVAREQGTTDGRVAYHLGRARRALARNPRLIQYSSLLSA